MKLKHLSICGLMSLALMACSDNDNPAPAPDDNQTQSSADIDYNEQNAASWGNYMTQVGALLKADAKNLYDSWTTSYEGGAAFSEQFKNHNGGDYSSALSCVEQIIDGCADIANEVGTAKIGDPFNLYVSGETERALYAVESWYSWHSRTDYSNNIYSIRNSYYGSLDCSISTKSLSTLVASVDAALDRKVKDAIAGAASAILAIPQPFRNNINSSEARSAMTACAELEELLSQNLKACVMQLSADDSRLQSVVENFVDAVVLPTYSDLSTKNELLHQACINFRKNPSDANFAAACNAWLVAREPWEKSEAFLFGPVDALGLDPNMDSWPLDQDAIVQILNSGNYDHLDWTDSDSDDKIEAVQSVRGFHTLEFLLFKDGVPRTIK